MEFGEQRYRKLLEQYTYTSLQSPVSSSYRAVVQEFPELQADGLWPHKAIENLKLLVLKKLQEMDSKNEPLPGENTVSYITNPHKSSEYQAFLVSNMDNAAKALMIASQYGMIEGEHHKSWVIDQMVRALTGKAYEAFIEHACIRHDKEPGEWDEGNVL